jgi:protein-disulfide isomerase
VTLHFPLESIHLRAVPAGEAAECAGRQGQYWPMHARLFADPPEIALTDFMAHAATIGLDAQAFSECLAGGALAKVQADKAEGRRLNVTGTPSFFLGTVAGDGGIELVTRINGAASQETFTTELDNLRAALVALNR